MGYSTIWCTHRAYLVLERVDAAQILAVHVQRPHLTTAAELGAGREAAHVAEHTRCWVFFVQLACGSLVSFWVTGIRLLDRLHTGSVHLAQFLLSAWARNSGVSCMLPFWKRRPQAPRDRALSSPVSRRTRSLYATTCRPSIWGLCRTGRERITGPCPSAPAKTGPETELS
jgi:hypothetical protein